MVVIGRDGSYIFEMCTYDKKAIIMNHRLPGLRYDYFQQ